MSPNLTVAAYSHFGARSLKGAETYHLVEQAWRRGYLRQVLAVSKKHCRQTFDLKLVDTLPGESRLLSGLLQIRTRVWKAFPSRWLGEMLFDWYAAARLTRRGDVLIITPGMVTTARKGKKLGYKVLLYGATPDPRFLEEQIQIERQALGLATGAEHRNRSGMMTRWLASLDATDHLIAVSEFSKDTYVAHGFPEARISVAPLGVGVERFPKVPLPTAGPFTYLFVGHVDGTTGIVKGLHYLLRAWSELALHDARLVICGKLGAEARELIRRHHPDLRHVEFTGPVNDVPTYYRNSSVFVLPSVAEGMAKVTIEAMSTGRPVIVTPNCGAVARDGVDGFYVRPRDVADLKERMRYFHDRRGEVARMGAQASEWAQQFTWERFSRQIADIVEEAAGAPVIAR